MLYVELDGNANAEGAAFERKDIRSSEVSAKSDDEATQSSDATGFLRATPDLHTQGTDASGFLPSPGGNAGGFDYGSPENDETQLDEMPAARTPRPLSTFEPRRRRLHETTATPSS